MSLTRRREQQLGPFNGGPRAGGPVRPPRGRGAGGDRLPQPPRRDPRPARAPHQPRAFTGPVGCGGGGSQGGLGGDALARGAHDLRELAREQREPRRRDGEPQPGQPAALTLPSNSGARRRAHQVRPPRPPPLFYPIPAPE
eukprot:1177465-Prorocentrum_minimum.AAC.2